MVANKYQRALPRRLVQAGVSLIEVLVSIFIIAISLLGLAGMQARATNAEFESYQRSQAIMLANDMVERMKMNRSQIGTYKNISSYVGTTGTGAFSIDCTNTGLLQAEKDLCAWSGLLQGSSEKIGTTAVGAMIDARGCISYDATTEYGSIADTGIYTVTVVWQGTQDTVPPASTCAANLYGSESKRRAVSMSFRVAQLS